MLAVLEALGSDLMIGDRIFFKCEKFAIDLDGEKCSPYVIERGIDSIFRYEHKGRWVQFERWLCNAKCANDEEVEKIKRFAKEYFTN